MLICVILFYGCIKRCFPSSILCCCVSTYRVMQQRAVPVKEVWGAAAAVIKVDHWHVGIHFVVVVGLEEKKFQWIQISVGMFLSF